MADRVRTERRRGEITNQEIEQNFRIVAENQAQFSFDLDALRERTEKLAGAGQVLEEAAALHQQVLREHAARQAKLEEVHAQLVELLRRHEERLDERDEALQATDEKLDALINAQVSYEARQSRLEESYQLLVQLARIQEERIDGHDAARQHTDARLDGLIDAQIDFSERLAQLAALQAEHKREADERGARLDEKPAQLQETQTRAAEQIRLLMESNGSKGN